MTSASPSSLSSVENIPGDVVKRICKELSELKKSPIDGITIEENEQNIKEINCVIQGPESTPYFGGTFSVRLSLPTDFPKSPPKGHFLTRIFHPNIAPSSGEICVNTLKKDWKANLGIKHILMTIRCLLIAPNPESALNEDAGRLLLGPYEAFAKRAALFTEIYAMRKTGVNGDQSSGASSSTNHSLKRAGASDGVESAKSKKAKESKKNLKRL